MCFQYSGVQCVSKRMQSFGETCYLLSEFPTTYSRAKKFCKNLEMTLVDIENEMENPFAQIMLSDKKGTCGKCAINNNSIIISKFSTTVELALSGHS